MPHAEFQALIRGEITAEQYVDTLRRPERTMTQPRRRATDHIERPVRMSRHLLRRTARAREAELEAKDPAHRYRVVKVRSSIYHYQVVQLPLPHDTNGDDD